MGDSVIKQNGTGNIGVGGLPFAGARLGVTGNIDAAGDITVNNVSSRSKITATGDINGKSLTASGDVTASGNVAATGAVSATQYKIGTNVIFSAPGTNTIMGVGAGTAAGISGLGASF